MSTETLATRFRMRQFPDKIVRIRSTDVEARLGVKPGALRPFVGESYRLAPHEAPLEADGALWQGELHACFTLMLGQHYAQAEKHWLADEAPGVVRETIRAFRRMRREPPASGEAAYEYSRPTNSEMFMPQNIKEPGETLVSEEGGVLVALLAARDGDLEISPGEALEAMREMYSQATWNTAAAVIRALKFSKHRPSGVADAILASLEPGVIDLAFARHRRDRRPPN